MKPSNTWQTSLPCDITEISFGEMQPLKKHCEFRNHPSDLESPMQNSFCHDYDNELPYNTVLPLSKLSLFVQHICTGHNGSAPQFLYW